MTSYLKTRYHPPKFHGANPRGPREIFNRAHSSLRSCIERVFDVLKARWKILAKLPKYSSQDQNIIVCAAFALHNYIRRSKVPDSTFRIIDEDSNFIPLEVFPDAKCNFMQEVHYVSTNKITKVHNDVTTSLMVA